MKCCWHWTQIITGTEERLWKAFSSFQSLLLQLVFTYAHHVWDLNILVVLICEFNRSFDLFQS